MDNKEVINLAERTSKKFKLFPSTRWTQVHLAGADGDAVKRQALEGLLKTYLPAMESYLLLKRRISPQYIDDLLQNFITHQVLEKDALAGARRDRGRFRNYVKTLLDRYVVTDYRRRTAAKRNAAAAVSLDQALEPASAGGDDSGRCFDLEWARAILTSTLEQMRQACQFSNREDVWTLFELRLIRPLLYGEPQIPYAQLIEQLGLQSPSQATNRLTTGKRMFVRILRSIIGQYADDDHQIDQEISDLFQILPMTRTPASDVPTDSSVEVDQDGSNPPNLNPQRPMGGGSL